MALIAPTITSLPCSVSKHSNNPPTFLISKFHNAVASSSSAKTANRMLSSCVYSPVSSILKKFDHKTSIEYSHKLNIKKVKNILVSNRDDPFENLEMINAIQGLGIDLYFRHEIDQTLHMIYKEPTHFYGRNLREVALCFRLLRQEGYYVQESIFKNVLDKKGGLEDNPKNDVKVLIELYEASELRVEGEETLDGVRDFTFNCLNELCSGRKSHQEREIMSSLAQPRHKTLRRLTSIRFMSMIKLAGQEDKEWLQSLLLVAEIDSIRSKSLIQEEMSRIFKWWRELNLEKELKKARNQPLKWHTWSMEILQDPTLTEQRLDLTKPISLVYVIDDIFDVYGELEELIIFTQVVERWDHKGLETLPRYMKVCFEALDMITMEISMKICKSHGWNPTYSLRKSWASLCKAFLIEAKWFHSGYLPNTEEYMKNGVVSSGVHLVMLHAYILLGEELTKEKVELIESNPGIVSSAATILRLWDDLGSAKDENQDGTDGSYVECYLNEYKGSTVDEARTHVVQKISKEWKRLNRECLNPSPFSRSFSKACLNIARTVPLMYSYDDDQRLPGLEEYLKSLM
ncbi:Isoprenoid synthase domain superfamily [Arabidopsis suecica]|uniref:Isoprenoid synthase domain superfamily n=1 Tax=Arabidopsis suecica TaxID=45249 RepID=A0A8T2BPS9_ARASU|nr:Isoprenoid synthase domain superfamily [Arabidopsis suecica]